ncbi:MAG: hypothetical protein AB7P22_07660 [Vicinamibacterales bacterium]
MDLHTLIDRARSEFNEMPGLRLTLPQASRLWNLDVASCERIIDALVGDAFLRWTSAGSVVRVDRSGAATAAIPRAPRTMHAERPG